MPIIACHKDDQDMCNVQNSIKFCYLQDPNIDILHPMFAPYYVSQIRLIVARNTTVKLVNQIEISNCGARVAGLYNAEIIDEFQWTGTCVYYKAVDGHNEIHINLRKNKVGDWIIETMDEGDGGLLFVCKGSRCETLPPKIGWEKINDVDDNDYDDNENQQNLPVLSYYHKNDTGRNLVKI